MTRCKLLMVVCAFACILTNVQAQTPGTWSALDPMNPGFNPDGGLIEDPSIPFWEEKSSEGDALRTFSEGFGSIADPGGMYNFITSADMQNGPTFLPNDPANDSPWWNYESKASFISPFIWKAKQLTPTTYQCPKRIRGIKVDFEADYMLYSSVSLYDGPGSGWGSADSYLTMEVGTDLPLSPTSATPHQNSFTVIGYQPADDPNQDQGYLLYGYNTCYSLSSNLDAPSSPNAIWLTEGRTSPYVIAEPAPQIYRGGVIDLERGWWDTSIYNSGYDNDAERSFRGHLVEDWRPEEYAIYASAWNPSYSEDVTAYAWIKMTNSGSMACTGRVWTSTRSSQIIDQANTRITIYQ